jgi:ribosome-associated protein
MLIQATEVGIPAERTFARLKASPTAICDFGCSRNRSRLGIETLIDAFHKNQVADMSADENSEPTDEPLRLDHFLKTMGISETGGQAKLKIQNSEVKVNGQVETRRRRKLVPTDVVEVNGKKFVVKAKT